MPVLEHWNGQCIGHRPHVLAAQGISLRTRLFEHRVQRRRCARRAGARTQPMIRVECIWLALGASDLRGGIDKRLGKKDFQTP